MDTVALLDRCGGDESPELSIELRDEEKRGERVCVCACARRIICTMACGTCCARVYREETAVINCRMGDYLQAVSSRLTVQ